MNVTAFGHALETINDGLTGFAGGAPVPVPLADTAIAVDIRAGLAVLRITRRFRNVEDRPIEAIMTTPVGFDAVVTGLRAVVDGRVLNAVAKPKAEARERYETALDQGKLAVLHEEVLRGVHALSVGNLAAGAEVSVEIEAVMPLAATELGPFLRIPVTVGQLYGCSPLAPVDDLVTSAAVRHEASLSVTVDAGRAMIAGRPVAAAERITLDAAIEIVVEGGAFGVHHGVAADGRQVRIDLRPVLAGPQPLDLAVLVDHSGSTSSPAAGPRGLTVWEAMRDGLRLELGRLRGQDRLALWEFATSCQRIGAGTGPSVAGLVARLAGPAGGTELDGAVEAVIGAGARDILVLTDGQTWSSTVDALAASKARISAILVGSGSLDANIGQLCAMTGGQVFYAAGDDVAASLSLALAALRRKGKAVAGTVAENLPERAVALRGGVEIVAAWLDAMELLPADATGRFAAALALPLLAAEAAEDWARAHGLCTHRTSLILVDDGGEAVAGMAQQRVVPMMKASMSRAIQPAVQPTYSAFRAPTGSMEMLSADVDRSLPVRAMFSLNEDACEFPNPVVPAEEIRLAFAALRWDVLCDDLLYGNLDGLNDLQKRILAELVSVGAIDRFARAMNLSPETVALALIADLIDDRLARRFLRRAFRNLTTYEWAHLRLWEQSPRPALRAVRRP